MTKLDPGGTVLESGPKKHSKLRLRFNFSGQKKGNTGKSTRDNDILDSLTRQAHLQDPPVIGTIGQNTESVESVQRQGRTHRHAGRSAFLVFMGGFLAVWGYGYVTKAYDIPYLSSLLQNQAVGVAIQTVTANPLPAGAVSVFVLVSVLYARHRRKSSSP